MTQAEKDERDRVFDLIQKNVGGITVSQSRRVLDLIPVGSTDTDVFWHAAYTVMGTNCQCTSCIRTRFGVDLRR